MANGNTWTGLGEGLQNVAQTIMQMYALKRENEDRKLRQQQVQSGLETDALQRALLQKQTSRFDVENERKDAKGALDQVGLEEFMSNPAYMGQAKALGINIDEKVLPSRSLGAVAPTGEMGGMTVAPSGDYVNGVRLPSALAREIQGEKLKQQTAQLQNSAAGMQLSEAQRRQQALQQVLGGDVGNDPRGRIQLGAAGLQPNSVFGEVQETPEQLRAKYGAMYGAQYGAMRDAGAIPPREDPNQRRMYASVTTIVDNISQELRRLESVPPRALDPQAASRAAKIAQLRAAQQKLYASLVAEKPDPVALQEAIAALTAPEAGVSAAPANSRLPF